jgi:hypothetical protein
LASSDPGHDRLAQIAAVFVPAALAPAAKAWVTLLEEVRLIAGLMKLYLGQRRV